MDLVETARSLGFDVKNIAAPLDDRQVAKLRQEVEGPGGGPLQEQPRTRRAGWTPPKVEKPKAVPKAQEKKVPGRSIVTSGLKGAVAGEKKTPISVAKFKISVPGAAPKGELKKKVVRKRAEKPGLPGPVEATEPGKAVAEEKTSPAEPATVAEKPAARKTPARKPVEKLKAPGRVEGVEEPPAPDTEVAEKVEEEKPTAPVLAPVEKVARPDKYKPVGRVESLARPKPSAASAKPSAAPAKPRVEPVEQVELPKELIPSDKPLTIRKKRPGRQAKIIYRPGDEGGPPVRHASKKKRPTPMPLARIRLGPPDEDTRGIKFHGKGLGRENEARRWTGQEEIGPDGTAVRPRLPFRRDRQRVPPPAKVVAKIQAKPTQAELVSPVSIKDFSSALGIKASLIITKLMQMGIMANINQALDDSVVGLLADELSVKVVLMKPKDFGEDLLEERKVMDKPEDLQTRAPVVTFLGHVDHGKTSLLDAIRKANVVSTESGGITQHIGAYKVASAQGKGVVFLDTPGHEAFTEMRARGANVTDVAVLVVAADDGVMPQTEEAINHATEAKVPIVVAINKIDLPQANPDRTKQQLSGLGLIWDGWGGNTVMVQCSAVTRKGLDDLVEMLSLEAELLELKANPARLAEGTVIEARSSEGRGVTATILVRNGTLHVGDVILCGRAFGHVRAMYDDKGIELPEAGPSTPVSVTGLSVLPEAGDRMYVMENLTRAKEVAEERARKMRSESLGPRRGVKLEEFFEYMTQSKVKELRVIIKADVKGSLEVLKKTVPDVATSEVRVRVIHGAVGGINESDILLAAASDAIVIGFHVAPEEKARLLAEEKGVDVRLYQVIYQVTDEVKKAVEGLLAPEKKEVVDGHVEVREIFKVSRLGTVAGCYVTDGVLNRSSRIRVVRDGKMGFDGKIETLKRFKDDVREVRAGFECGVKVAGYDDVKVGDQFESYHVEEIARKLA
jgi:translation initiation factor IF-2